jgi:hypothetical protein
MSGDDFDWSSGSESVVLRAYGSIAVHENPYGDVVVRQERDALEDDDQWVVIPVQDAELIAQAIIDKANQIKAESRGDRQPEQPEQPRLALPAPAPNGRQPMNGPRQKSGAGNGT